MKSFTLDEARAMLPELRSLLLETNREVDDLISLVQIASKRFDEAEVELARAEGDCAGESGIENLRKRQEEFQQAFLELQKQQATLLHKLELRVDELSLKGVVLRNLREGLLDFPACRNGFEYFLCWKLDEDDIRHWHLTSEGFTGRRPLICLLEYC